MHTHTFLLSSKNLLCETQSFGSKKLKKKENPFQKMDVEPKTRDDALASIVLDLFKVMKAADDILEYKQSSKEVSVSEDEEDDSEEGQTEDWEELFSEEEEGQLSGETDEDLFYEDDEYGSEDEETYVPGGFSGFLKEIDIRIEQLEQYLAEEGDQLSPPEFQKIQEQIQTLSDAKTELEKQILEPEPESVPEPEDVNEDEDEPEPEPEPEDEDEDEDETEGEPESEELEETGQESEVETGIPSAPSPPPGTQGAPWSEEAQKGSKFETLPELEIEEEEEESGVPDIPKTNEELEKFLDALEAAKTIPPPQLTDKPPEKKKGTSKSAKKEKEKPTGLLATLLAKKAQIFEGKKKKKALKKPDKTSSKEVESLENSKVFQKFLEQNLEQEVEDLKSGKTDFDPDFDASWYAAEYVQQELSDLEKKVEDQKAESDAEDEAFEEAVAETLEEIQEKAQKKEAALEAMIAVMAEKQGEMEQNFMTQLAVVNKAMQSGGGDVGFDEDDDETDWSEFGFARFVRASGRAEDVAEFERLVKNLQGAIMETIMSIAIYERQGGKHRALEDLKQRLMEYFHISSSSGEGNGENCLIPRGRENPEKNLWSIFLGGPKTEKSVQTESKSEMGSARRLNASASASAFRRVPIM